MTKKLLSFVVSIAIAASLSPAAIANPGRGNSGNTPAAQNSVTLPDTGKKVTDDIVKEVGKPDFAGPQTTTPSAPGNSGNAPGNSTPIPGAPVTLPGNSGSAPGNSGSTPGNSGAAPGKTLGNLTPAGITRKTQTPAASASKLENVKAECKDAVTTGVEDPACITKNYVIRYVTGADVEVEAKGLGNRLLRSFGGVIPGASARLSAKDLAELASFSTVLTIEEDFVIRLTETQTNATWGLDRSDQAALPLSTTYTYNSTGAGVRAYVVDTGVLSSHSEFTGRMTSGYSAIADGRGTTDCNGHGTHVAGTVAGTRFGIAKAVTVVPVRVLDCAGSGTLSGVLAGLSWIGNDLPASTPAVVNMSLGGAASSTLDSAVQSLIDRGVTVVVAAGNSTADACQASPARVPGAITVAASARDDVFASYSNFGSCVDVIAPGTGVTSAWYTSNTASATISGTSMAAPHVAGLVAQQLEFGYLVPANIDAALKAAAVSGAISSVPAGTVNLLARVFASNTAEPDADAPVTEEPTPTEPTPTPTEPTPTEPAPTEPAQPGKGAKVKPVAPGKAKVKTIGNSAEISWPAPKTGTSTLTLQHVKLYSFGELVAVFDVEPTDRTLVVEGLEFGLGYSVTVIAENPLGESPESVQSDVFRPKPLQKPSDGKFQGWTRVLADNQVKFYVKYPQVGQKIQFLVQQRGGEYRELAWLRITSKDLNSQGQYANLTNSAYFVRTLNLAPGKNRVKIMVDGKQLGTTKTYSLK